MAKQKNSRPRVPKGANRMPDESLFYDKIVPIMLIGLAILMVLLILVAAGFLFGIISF